MRFMRAICSLGCPRYSVLRLRIHRRRPSLFPINILPPALAHILNFTPFPYLLYFPVNVYLGAIKGLDLAQGLAIQFAWLAFFWLLSQFVWRRGIKKYSAVGG